MNPAEIRDRFNKLNVWKANGLQAPHKPLLILWAIGRCLRGESRMASFIDTRQALSRLLRRFGLPNTSIHPEYPFWRLRNDKIWEVSRSDRITETSRGDALVSSLIQEKAHGGFPRDIYNALQENEQLAIQIVNLLLEVHFSSNLHEKILHEVGINYEGRTVDTVPIMDHLDCDVFG